MKSVGKRKAAGQALNDQGRLARTAVALRGAGLVPRGVYRFRSFEEADAWMTTMMLRSRARRNQKTSPASVER
jgi:hypothetical protein